MEGTRTVRSISRSPLSKPSQPRNAPRRQSARAGRRAVVTSAPEEVRWSLVQRVRAQIAAGTYETQAKLDFALDALMDQIP